MSKYTHVSLFAGAGGLDIGFEQAGFETIWANDNFHDACETHRAWCKCPVIEGDITKVDFNTIPDCDVASGGFPCFTGDTLVLTENGYIPIKEIRINDYVMGNDGKFHKVLNTFENGIKDIVTIKCVNTDIINTTLNHKFFIRTRKNGTMSDPKWVSVEEMLSIDDSKYCALPINDEEIIPDWNGCDYTFNSKIKHLQNLKIDSEKLWYLVGRYIGDGYLKYNREADIKKPSGIVIACGKHKAEKFEKIINGFLHYTKTNERTVFKYYFSNIELYYFMKQFGSNAHTKNVPGFVYKLPVNLLSSLIQGYYDSDGNVRRIKGIEKMCLNSVNKNLLCSFSYIVSKVYHVPCSLTRIKMKPTTIIEGRIVNQHDMFKLEWNPNSMQTRSFYEDGYIWYHISSIEKTDKKEMVYDIEVEDVHSFIVENMTAHNCQGFSLAGPRKIDDSRNTLYKQCVKLLEVKKPKIFVAENVKGFLTLGNGAIKDAVIKDFEDKGYDVTINLFNTKDYHVPEDRQRIIIVAIRKDLVEKYGVKFEVPKPFDDIITIRQALKDIEKPKKEDICWAPYSSRYMSRNRKRNWDDVSFTIPAMAKQVPLYPGSPDMKKIDKDLWKFGEGETRRFSYKEAAAIQTFPKDMEWKGDLTNIYKQIGNAVPCEFARILALELIRILDNCK